MVAAGLDRSCRATGISGAGARAVADLRGSPELPGHHDEHAIGETAVVDILDEGRDGIVIRRGPEAEGLEDVVIDGVVVPDAGPAAQRPAQFGGDDVDPRLHQPPGHEQLLPPGIASVAVAGGVILAGQIEGMPRLTAGEELEGLRLEGVERLHLQSPADRALERVELPANPYAAAEAILLGGTPEAEIRNGERWRARITGDDEWPPGIAEIGGAVVAERRIDADIPRQRVRPRSALGEEAIGDAHPIRKPGLGLVLGVHVAGEHLHRSGRMPARRLRHRPEYGEPVGDRRLAWKELRESQARHLCGDRLEGATVVDRRLGLGVVGVDMRTPPRLPDHDHALR